MPEVILFLCGLAIGSFLNVLIDRLPQDEDVVYGRSHCDYCKKPLRWYELIPVISFLLQGGRCRRCHKRLSGQYPFIEIVTGILFVVVSRYPYASPVELVGRLTVASSLLVIFMTDVKTQIIPDSILVAAIAGFIPDLTRLSVLIIASHIGTGLLCALGFYFLYLMTKKRGMGFGDVKLAGVVGLLLGFPNTITALYAAFLTGAIAGVILILSRRAGMKSRIAFGPFLVFGILVATVWGSKLIELWQKLLG